MDGLSPPEGVQSILDTDLYKLTMQCAVLHHYPDVGRSTDCTYAFTNRTPDLKITRGGFEWLQNRISELRKLELTDSELQFLKDKCPYLPSKYLDFLHSFHFKPDEQVAAKFTPVQKNLLSKRAELEELCQASKDEEFGDVEISVQGKWLDTILYEIPLLVLVSECYFKFGNTDWSHDGQEEKAKEKGKRLLESGCLFSEFGTRRRRSYHTQCLVLKGLIAAQEEFLKQHPDEPGKFTGTSNVHFAHRFNLNPIGTVAHEWFMGIAAVTGNYTNANEIGLRQWISTFGPGTLSIALTDTFGTPAFLKNFSRPCDLVSPPQSYAQLFAGVRQDSGDPTEFVKLMRNFYDSQGITDQKTIVFSDSLDIEKCIEYKKCSESYGFHTSFGVGTFLTNDFEHIRLKGRKSVPMNIVIKISSANGKPAVKISDNIGKNTGDKNEVKKAKEVLGYKEKEWEEGDEMYRWGGKEDAKKN